MRGREKDWSSCLFTPSTSVFSFETTPYKSPRQPDHHLKEFIIDSFLSIFFKSGEKEIKRERERSF